MSKNQIPSETPPLNGALLEGLLLADAAGIINFATPPAEQLFGCLPQSLAGKSLAELLDAADRPAAQNSLAAALARPGLGVAGVYSLRHTEGAQTQVETVITSLPEQAGGNTVIVTVRPAARPAAQDRELQELAELHRITMENILDPVFITDDADRFTFICANVVHSLGYFPAEMQAMGNIAALAGDNIFDPAELDRYGLIPNIERDVIDKAGKIRTFLITVRRVSIQGGTVLHIWREITLYKQTTQALQESEEKFRALYELLPDAIFLALADTGIIVDANSAATRLLQRPRSQIIGLHHTALHPPAQLAPAQQTFVYRPAAGEDAPPVEIDVVCGDGTCKPVEIRGRAIILGGQAYVLGVFRDMTDRKNAELALRRYMHMISATPSSVSLVDRNYVYQVVNNAYLRRTAKNIDEIVDHPVADVMGTEVFERMIKPNLDRCFNGETVRYQAWFHFPSEGRRFVDVTYAPYRDDDNTLSGALVSVRDITNLSRAEEALRESESRFRAVWEIASDALALSDPDGTVVAANPAYSKLYGYPLEEVIGQNFAIIFPLRQRAQAMEQYRAVFNAPESPAAFETEIERANGERRLVESRISFITRNGLRVAMLSTIRDITERKQNEERIKAALAEKEVLLRELYHRTKNNMQVIGSLLSLQATQAKSASVSTVFKEMETRIRAMALVHQKLYQSQNLSSLDLKEYISDLALLLSRSYRLDADRVSLVLELEPVPVLIDTAIPCGLILHELISNAFKHGFPGKRRGQIRICLSKTGDAIALQVSDNGVGLATDFDPRQSQTLGLQTILGIGEHQLQGQVTLKTGPGVTCTIQFKDNLYQARI